MWERGFVVLHVCFNHIVFFVSFAFDFSYFIYAVLWIGGWVAEGKEGFPFGAGLDTGQSTKKEWKIID